MTKMLQYSGTLYEPSVHELLMSCVGKKGRKGTSSFSCAGCSRRLYLIGEKLWKTWTQQAQNLLVCMIHNQFSKTSRISLWVRSREWKWKFEIQTSEEGQVPHCHKLECTSDFGGIFARPEEQGFAEPAVIWNDGSPLTSMETRRFLLLSYSPAVGMKLLNDVKQGEAVHGRPQQNWPDPKNVWCNARHNCDSWRHL